MEGRERKAELVETEGRIDFTETEEETKPRKGHDQLLLKSGGTENESWLFCPINFLLY